MSCQELTVTTSSDQTALKMDPKINGLTMVATRSPITIDQVDTLARFNPSHVAIVPYGFMKEEADPIVKFNLDWQWWGERVSGVDSTIQLLQKRKLRVMLKPQLWVRGSYTGTITYNDEQDWMKFENSYRDYVLAFAKVAADLDIAIYCLGTEIDAIARARPLYFKKLIDSVKTIYDGKITYAANWDSYLDIPFWKDLDYIGVDAYFPVSDERTPTLAKVRKNWTSHLSTLQKLSDSTGKPVLFTEYGYVSADYAGKEPWQNAENGREENQQAQVELLQALYDTVWPQQWFAGGFLWKIHIERNIRGLEKQYTPQNKIGEKTIYDHYSNK